MDVTKTVVLVILASILALLLYSEVVYRNKSSVTPTRDTVPPEGYYTYYRTPVSLVERRAMCRETWYQAYREYRAFREVSLHHRHIVHGEFLRTYGPTILRKLEKTDREGAFSDKIKLANTVARYCAATGRRLSYKKVREFRKLSYTSTSNTRKPNGDLYWRKLLRTVHKATTCDLTHLREFGQVSEDIQDIVDNIVSLRLKASRCEVSQ